MIRSAVGAGWLAMLTCGAVHSDPSPDRQRDILHLLRNDCGACHGMTLKGGLGLPLTPDALRDKDDDGLRNTILQGRPGTPMPPWRPFLSEDEARWLVAQLKRGIPAQGQ